MSLHLRSLSRTTCLLNQAGRQGLAAAASRSRSRLAACRFLSVNTTLEAKVLPADRLISWDTRCPVRLRMEDTPPGNETPRTVPEMLDAAAAKHPDRVAVKIKRDGQWREWNYRETMSDVRTVAKAFQSLGLSRFHGIGVLGPNCPEWFLSSAGAIYGGGLSVGIYATNSPEAVSYICHHCPVDVLVLSDAAELARVLDGRAASEAFPTVRAYVLMEGEANSEKLEGTKVLAWRELMELGRSLPEAGVDQALAEIAPNQACMLLYTSGTTGPPKGAILSHDNVTWGGFIAMNHYGWKEAEETVLSFLPLSHIAPIMIDLYMNMGIAGTVAFADKNALKGTLVENLKEVRPTRFWGVPRVYEKVKEKMQEVARQNTGAKKALGNWAKAAALERRQNLRKGIEKESISYKLARKLVLSRIHEALGLDQLRNDPHASSAPLDDATAEYFDSLDLGLPEFYGMTEATGPITTNMPGERRRVGTVGHPYWGVSVKLLDVDPEGVGEVAFFGRNTFMGYHKQEAETKKMFTDDGWARTGDLGWMDEDDFLTIKGRVKELIITSGGENIAPVPIEDAIKEQLPEVVSNAIVVGDRRKFLTCLLTLRVQVDADTQQPTDLLDPRVVAWAESLGVDGLAKVEDFASGPHADRLAAAVQEGVDRANRKAISNAAKVQKFRLLPHELSQVGGELGPTLKTKRYFVYQKYEKLIQEMYDE